MKRFFLVLCMFLSLTLTLSGCDCSSKKDIDYLNYVSELRSNVYQGKSQDYNLKASYGYKEFPYINDGKIGKKQEILTFELLDITNLDITYFLTFSHNECNYEKQFVLNNHQSVLTCEVEIKDFNTQNFTVSVGTLNEKQAVVLKSIVPDKSLDYKGAINSLIKNQPSLLEGYKNQDGEFCAEIYARILVKEGKAYWYIGIANGENSLKALLIDGANGEILAVREVF